GKVWDPKELAALGEKIYAANCVACHQATGQGVPGTFPALAGSKIVNGAPGDQIHIVLEGKPGTAMPPWKALSDSDIAAVIDYTRSSWGNKGAPVQPADVKAGRG
ncbi:MAG: cytochrome c, partial [Betaproteobacteria bacterium]